MSDDFRGTQMIRSLFTSSASRYDGIVPLNVYLLRLTYVLMLVFLGKDSWTYILTHKGQWEPMDAMAWSLWAAFASLGLLGVFHPVRMLPILLLEVFYKVLWLILVAYPLWTNGRLAGSSAEGMTYAFAWVILPIIAIPWPYVARTFLHATRKATQAESKAEESNAYRS
jgi:hypothetical protein